MNEERGLTATSRVDEEPASGVGQATGATGSAVTGLPAGDPGDLPAGDAATGMPAADARAGMPAGDRQARKPRWARVGLSVALLAVVLAVSDPARILPAIAKADPKWLAAAAALWAGIQLLNVWKWWLLGRAQGLAVGYRALLDIYFIGMFFNTFLPSGFGGDVFRAYELSKLTPQGGGGSTASVMIDRFTSVYALCLVAGAALLMAPAEFRTLSFMGIGTLVVGGAAGLAALLWADRLPWVGRWLVRGESRTSRAAGHEATKGPRPRLVRFLVEVASAMSALRGAWLTLVAALAVSVLYQFLAVVLHYCFILALGLEVSFAYTTFFFPILSLAASLPVTINGLAIREGGFALFLGRVGVPPADAVAVGLLSLALLLLSGLWGAIVYAGFRRSHSLPASDTIPW